MCCIWLKLGASSPEWPLGTICNSVALPPELRSTSLSMWTAKCISTDGGISASTHRIDGSAHLTSEARRLPTETSVRYARVVESLGTFLLLFLSAWRPTPILRWLFAFLAIDWHRVEVSGFSSFGAACESSRGAGLSSLFLFGTSHSDYHSPLLRIRRGSVRGFLSPLHWAVGIRCVFRCISFPVDLRPLRTYLTLSCSVCLLISLRLS